MPAPLTPVQRFGAWYCKREDAAGYTSEDMPSGAKVRAYGQMIAASAPGAPMVVGCSADGLMQVYVAAAAQQHGRTCAVCVPKRKKRSSETTWAAEHGAELLEVYPGYPTQYRSGARKWASEHPHGVVKWSPMVALEDTAEQVANVPADCARVVVPVGTGAICAGVMAGLARAGRSSVQVLAVAVSGKAQVTQITDMARRAAPCVTLPPFALTRAPGEYSRKVAGTLPDGTELDPAYAAKAYVFVQDGDVLWNTGRRPGLRYVPPEGT